MSKSADEPRSRRQIKRALRFMNKHKLTEFEFEDKEGDQTLVLKRSEGESHPPILEGRSSPPETEVRSPATGKLEWDVEPEASVEAGDRVGVVQKHREEVPVRTPVPGTIRDLYEGDRVEYGQFLAEVDPASESDDAEADQ